MFQKDNALYFGNANKIQKCDSFKSREIYSTIVCEHITFITALQNSQSIRDHH